MPSKEEAWIEKKVCEESEDERRVEHEKKGQHNSKTAPKNTTFAFMCYLLVWEKYCPTNQLWLRNCSLVKRPLEASGNRWSSNFYLTIELVLHNTLIHNVKTDTSSYVVIFEHRSTRKSFTIRYKDSRTMRAFFYALISLTRHILFYEAAFGRACYRKIERIFLLSRYPDPLDFSRTFPFSAEGEWYAIYE